MWIIKRIHNEIGYYIQDHGGGFIGFFHLSKIIICAFFKLGPKSLWNLIREYLFGADQITGLFNSGFTTTSFIKDIVPIKSIQHSSSVDIVVCVHNAIEDVRRCLQSIIEFTTKPYQLIIIDDGSDEPTATLLREFSLAHDAFLLRNDSPQHYTRAANIGLHKSQGDYVVLINSDAIVTEGWLDRLIMCAESDPNIGIVGPLSNTASWQSIPNYESDADWADNPLPEGITVGMMGILVERYSKNIFPRMPFLNGFCMLIRREVINQVEYFDEEAFPFGYGEENDYCLRARSKGWSLALADNTYIFHAQSKSYGHKKRQILSKSSTDTLIRMYGKSIIDEGVAYCRESLVLNGIRAHSKYYHDRNCLLQKGRHRFSGLRVLFLLPVHEIGGGANIVLREAQAMQAMGVEVCIANLRRYYASFKRHYGDTTLPIIYLSSLAQIGELGDKYDAVIATTNFSIEPIKLLANKRPILGYYIQDFEPYFYKQDSPEYDMALRSYSLIDRMVLFTKTPWNRDKVKEIVGKDASIVGPSFDVDLFIPRPRFNSTDKIQPLKICAMVRPSSRHRGARLTLEVLRSISRSVTKETINIIIFGVEEWDMIFKKLPHDFPYENRGILSPREISVLLSDCDIFADFSEYQAMGLTAMEAMACGAAVIVPKAGGAQTFAEDFVNSLVIDTSSPNACEQAIVRLLIDHRLRRRLQKNAVNSINKYYPELAAFNILDVLFPSKPDKRKAS